MESFLIYIGKSALAAGGFYMAFLWLFQNQKHFVFNRLYLPISLALSFVIPLITFTSVKYVEPISQVNLNNFVFLPDATQVAEQPQFKLEWYHYLFAIYLLGSFGFLVNLLIGHLKAISIVKGSRIKKVFQAQVNITGKDVHPFSFFNKIVLSEQTLNNPDLKMIVSHENIHVKEKHTLDILFTEIMFLFQWFNPFSWLIKDAVKNNLEYKTDHIITQHSNPEAYQLAMVGLADKDGVAPFLTALNGSQLKNRIIMMKKKTENKYATLKQLVVLPLLAILVMSLSTKEVKKEILQPEIRDEVALADLNEKDLRQLVVNVDGKIIPSNHSGLQQLDFSKGFDSGEVIEALLLDANEVEVNVLALDQKKPTLLIRTSDYVQGTDAEFEQLTKTTLQTVEQEAKSESYYAVNGLLVNEKEFNALSKNGFETFVVLSGYDAIEKYGMQVKNGTVLDVTTGQPKFEVSEEKGQVSGKIVSKESGESIAGVKVYSKFGDILGMSNLKGEFGFEHPQKVDDIMFVKPGFKPQHTNIDLSGKDKLEINIVLEKQTEKLSAENEEVVVVGYGRMKETPSSLVQGIRAADGKSPLYVVDDKIVKDISDLHPDDIESISVLKDASAIELYGEKGKDGVVIVCTKNRIKTENKLIIVDGKAYEGDLKNISPDNIKAISILKDESATAIYGKKGSNGVIVITTKDGKVQMETNSATKFDFKIRSDSSRKSENPPLFIMDGEKIDNIDQIDPDFIKSINVLKDKSANDKYGELGKNGVIEITLKQAAELGQNEIPVVLNGKTTNKKLIEIDRDLIEKVKKVEPKTAIKKYGDFGRFGVLEVTSRKLYSDKVEVKSKEEKEQISNVLELRKFFAKTIKYPVEAQEKGEQGKIVLFVKINKKGKVTKILEDGKNKDLMLDEVIVVAYNSEKVETIDNSDSKPLIDEARRIINIMPEIDIEELKGQTVGVTLNFVLQD